jgi:uncharacterized membrane protein (DUF373 family)
LSMNAENAKDADHEGRKLRWLDNTFTKLYVRLERAVAWALTAGMAVVILLAAGFFLVGVWERLFDVSTDWDYRTFQALFDRVLAAVIALELAHSIQQMASGKHGLIQVRTVILIGILAVVRKLILLEIASTEGLFLIGLGVTVLALSVAYALILWVEDNTSIRPPPSPGQPQ